MNCICGGVLDVHMGRWRNGAISTSYYADYPISNETTRRLPGGMFITDGVHKYGACNRAAYGDDRNWLEYIVNGGPNWTGWGCEKRLSPLISIG